MLMCQVTLRAAELVLQGVDQFCPSGEHFDTELMAEFKWKQRGIFRTWNEVPVISSCVYNKVNTLSVCLQSWIVWTRVQMLLMCWRDRQTGCSIYGLELWIDHNKISTKM